MEDLVFLHKHRRSAFAGNMASCQPANQFEAPIFSHHHSPIESKLSKINIISSQSSAKTEAKSGKLSKEKIERRDKFGTDFGISKSFSSSLHLKVSPNSSIIFDRQNVSSKLDLVPMIQPKGDKRISNALSSTNISRKNSLGLEKYGSTAPKNSESDVKCNPVKLKSSERTPPNQSLEIINPLRSFQTLEIAENRDEKIPNQHTDLNRVILRSLSVEHRTVVVRQLPLSYSMGDLRSGVPFCSRATQYDELSDGENTDSKNRPPSRDTIPDPPFVTLRKTYEEVLCSHAQTCRIRGPEAGLSPQLQRMGIGSLQGNSAHTKKSGTIRHTGSDLQIGNKSLSENDFGSQKSLSNAKIPEPGLPDLWDTETISVSSFSGRNSSHQHQRRRYCNQNCKRSKTYRGLFTRQEHNVLGVESSIPNPSRSITNTRMCVRRRSLEKGSKSDLLTSSKHEIRENMEVPLPKKVIRRNVAMRRSKNYQKHTFSSIQKMREGVHPHFEMILAAWR
ncbi:hypothetical protein Aperf_G00000125515 [Anoplocephala perfoliata]